MKEIWNRKLESFEGEVKRASSETGESFELSDDQKDQTLKEFLKTDKARLRAFISILSKMDEGEVDVSKDSESDNFSALEPGQVVSDKAERLNADFSKELKTLRALDAVDLFIKQYEKGEHSTLEPRQMESLVKIAAFLRSGKKRGYVELPTGLGKTVIFAELIEALKDVPGMKVLVVGSGNINVMQNVQKVERFGGGEVGQYFAGKKELHAKVTACNYHGLRSAVEKGNFKSGDFDIVLLDEVHDSLGEVTQESIEQTFKNETIIGFSATATYELSKGRAPSDFLPVEIDKMGVVEAVKANLLSALKVEIIKVPTVLESVRVIHGDYLPGELEKKINTKERNDLIVDSYMKFYRKAGAKTIAFCVTRQHAKDLTAVFEAQGIKAGVLTGKLDIDEREAVLQKWKSGEIEVLCGSKLAWQALDETEATVGLNVAPSLSEKDVIQRGGRLLRRSEVRSRKTATIVEFLDEWRETKNRPIFYSEILQTAEAKPDKWESVAEEKEAKKTVQTRPGIPEAISTPPLIKDSAEGKMSDVELTPENVASDGDDRVIRYSDATQIMAISNQNRKFRNEEYFEYAPKEWMSANIIAVELGARTSEVEAAIHKIREEISANKFQKNSGVYLSSLGIKRKFYGPEILDKVYTRLVGSTRAEKLKTGVIKGDYDFDELEKASAEKENEADKSVDLEWRDYDLLPSFTLGGDSLEDEEEGINIGDTSELHPKGEPIEGEINDLVGYMYQIHGGKFTNYKRSNQRPRQKIMLKETERYGLRPVRGLNQDDPDFRSEAEDREMEKIMMDIISSPGILTDRERTIILMHYLDNDDGKNTFEIIGESLGITRGRVQQISHDAIKKIKKAVEVYERTGKISSNWQVPDILDT